MKHMIFLALVSLAATALAQEKPAAKEPAKAEAMKEATKPEARQAATGPRMPHARRWHEDARHCLDLPSNTEIIKCAEEYL
ncbi:MAG TPA: hypothetical protein VIG70_18820 [Burkholderiales bacterium]|jgi:hypothetical protein